MKRIILSIFAAFLIIVGVGLLFSPKQIHADACVGLTGADKQTCLQNQSGTQSTGGPSSSTTNPTFQGDCNSGGVQVSIGLSQGSNNCVGGAGTNPIYAYIRGIIKFATTIFGILAVLMIIVTGIQYITSSGNPTAVVAAKKRLVNVIISIVLYFLMVGILSYLIPGGIL